jgi:quercetin dioxygenase-like cupin family protein
MTSQVAALLLLLNGLAAAQEATPISALEVKYRKQISRNDRVAVFLLEIPPNHATLMHRHDTDMLSIFVSGGETKSTIYGRPPQEDAFAVGDVRFRSAGFTHSTENVGATTFRVVILEFTSSMGSLLATNTSDSHYCNPDTTTACVDEKYILCTPRLCAQDLSLAPGAIWRNEGSGNDQMLVAVSDFELSGELKRTSAKVLRRKNGEVEYLPAGSSRRWRNTTSETAHVIVVSFR